MCTCGAVWTRKRLIVDTPNPPITISVIKATNFIALMGLLGNIIIGQHRLIQSVTHMQYKRKEVDWDVWINFSSASQEL